MTETQATIQKLPMLTVRDVARRLSMKEFRVRQLVREQVLPATFIGRQIRLDPDRLAGRNIGRWKCLRVLPEELLSAGWQVASASHIRTE